MKIISHRCAGFGAEENSLEGLRRALASEVDEVELDIRQTNGGTYYASHFPALTKTLRERLATLGEVVHEFGATSHGKGLRLDLKFPINPRLLAPHLVRIPPKSLTFMSLHPSVLRAAAESLPGSGASLSVLLSGVNRALDRLLARRALSALSVTPIIDSVTLISLFGETPDPLVVALFRDRFRELVVSTRTSVGAQRLRDIPVDAVLLRRPLSEL